MLGETIDTLIGFANSLNPGGAPAQASIAEFPNDACPRKQRNLLTVGGSLGNANLKEVTTTRLAANSIKCQIIKASAFQIMYEGRQEPTHF
ncbi:hypothetical protein D3C72_1723390 [compost metagenome]